MFSLSPDQQALVQAARATAHAELASTVKEDDEREHFRKDLFGRLGAAGLCGIQTAEEWGGLGLGYVEYALVIEEIAKVAPSYAVAVAVSGLPQVILAQFGNDAQRATWMPGLAAGELLGAFALSEPGSGSDASSLRTTAVLDGDNYRLNGTKFWITHGGVADVYVVMARTGGPGPKGISAFLVSSDTPGLSFGKKEEKMGLRASPTVEMVLEDAIVPVSNRIGPEGNGFSVAMSALDSGRITIAATALGLAQAAMDCAGRYAVTRKQFDTAIIDFQGVGFMLADMAVRIEQARLLTHKAAWLKDNKLAFSPIAAMAKLAATDCAMSVTTDAVQVMGGYGYTREYPVERLMRDAKVMQIVEGTNQVQRVVIARHLKRGWE
ncbi:MAG: acyl-CoA dehydrogenase [Myxococcales bacterium]|nr:acyl-CoA dehydrogenase [Myxococcales bacterium]